MRTITRSYLIRSYPNGAQRRLRDRWFGAYRWLWNTALEIRTAAYRECGFTLTGNDISRWLTQWKTTQGHEWLEAVPATCLTQCLRDQDSAFRNYFAGRAQYPGFKRKGSAGSLRFQGAGAAWKQQRCLSRRHKDSRRREKQKLRVARAHAKVRQARQYALHDLTTRLTQDYDFIFIEDLNVKALSRGRNARSIQDASFGEIRRQLTYKSEWRDKILIAVDRWYAGDACPEEILEQVLAEGDGVRLTRSGQCNRACLEKASLH